MYADINQKEPIGCNRRLFLFSLFKKRQSSAPLLLSGFEEIIKDKMKPSC